MELDAVARGVVNVYYPLKGYGFIRRTTGKDLFFYRDAFTAEELIVEGSLVEFKVEDTEKGPRAVNIARIG